MSEESLEKGEAAEGPPSEVSEVESKEGIIEALRAEVEKKEQTAREAQDRSLRTLADFENYKKRAQKERVDQAQFANERLIKEVLPVMDNIERAISHSKEKRDFDKILEGLELIQKQLLGALGKFGVTPIEGLHKPFDPFVHQSIGQIELEEGAREKEGQVVAETQKGYFLNERVIRPSLVMVSKKCGSTQVKEDKTGEEERAGDGGAPETAL